MENFPSNSKNVTGSSQAKGDSEQPKKDIQKVITGEVVQKPKTVGRRFKSVFFNGEAKGAMRYIFTDVLVPAMKNLIVDATSKGIERAVYGESNARRRYGGNDPRRPIVSYNRPVDRYSNPRTVMLPDQPPHIPGRGKKVETADIVLVSREEAELVLERLSDIIDKYDVASVADLHDLVGLPTTYVDNKWGWTRLPGVSVRQIREGYLLDLPPVEPI